MSTNIKTRYMRRSGKTTRLIDQAVQHLFDKGRVVVPISGLDNVDRSIRGDDPSTDIFFDPDSFNYEEMRSRPIAQRDFAYRLKSRLEIEHPGCFNTQKTGSEITFTLKSES